MAFTPWLRPEKLLSHYVSFFILPHLRADVAQSVEQLIRN